MNKFFASSLISFGYNAFKDFAIKSVKKSFNVKLKEIDFVSYDKEKTKIRIIFEFNSKIKEAPEMLIKGIIKVANTEIAEFNQTVKISGKKNIPFVIELINAQIKEALKNAKKNQDIEIKGNVKFKLLGIKFNFGFDKKENIFNLLN